MTHKRYEKYVDTQEAWLGSHPSHWGRKPLWTLFRRVKRQGFESEGLLSVYRDHGVIPKSSREDNFNKPSDDLGSYQLVEPGDLAVNKMKAWQGSVAISEHRGIVSPAYHVYTPLHSENQRFLHYLMRCDRYITGYLSISKGIRVNQWDLQPEYHSRMPVLLPPLEEQIAIASFLDRETAKIDALIAEQQRLIELLQEKRQAVISHAVTKGLNPNALMKDSGVEWLGEVPEHWNGCRFKHCLLGLTDAEHKTCPDYSDGEYLIVRTSNVRDGSLVLDGAKYTDANGYKEWTARCTPKAGDIVFTREAPAGEACIIPEGIAACLGQRTVLMHPSPSKVTPEYLVSSIYSGAARTFIQNLSQGSTVSHLNMSEIGNLPIALPPLEEQLHINEYTRDESRKFHALMQQAQTSIKLFQERRSALISAAVTGQIDVRGLTAEEEP